MTWDTVGVKGLRTFICPTVQCQALFAKAVSVPRLADASATPFVIPAYSLFDPQMIWRAILIEEDGGHHTKPNIRTDCIDYAMRRMCPRRGRCGRHVLYFKIYPICSSLGLTELKTVLLGKGEDMALASSTRLTGFNTRASKILRECPLHETPPLSCTGGIFSLCVGGGNSDCEKRTAGYKRQADWADAIHNRMLEEVAVTWEGNVEWLRQSSNERPKSHRVKLAALYTERGIISHVPTRFERFLGVVWAGNEIQRAREPTGRTNTDKKAFDSRGGDESRLAYATVVQPIQELRGGPRWGLVDILFILGDSMASRARTVRFSFVDRKMLGGCRQESGSWEGRDDPSASCFTPPTTNQRNFKFSASPTVSSYPNLQRNVSV
ncbi:hypothetical protein DFH06DRAFT_1119376 [Mycena polygramma]|nr:hypothetical protein DFH06DRAFT_1119376 [Mycena polygramma]